MVIAKGTTIWNFFQNYLYIVSILTKINLNFAGSPIHEMELPYLRHIYLYLDLLYKLYLIQYLQKNLSSFSVLNQFKINIYYSKNTLKHTTITNSIIETIYELNRAYPKYIAITLSIKVID